MRRALLVCGIFAMVGCGISAVATRDGAGPVEIEDATPNANLPDTSTLPVEGGPVEDAGLDADSALPTFPSHIDPADYTLEPTPLTITDESTIDTTKLTIDDVASPMLKAGTQGADPVAVWSVGPLTLHADLHVKGSRALVIVVNGDFVSTNTIFAAAGDPDDDEDDLPGPGGTTSGVAGMSVGGPGQSTTIGGAGGGGGGHATAGGAGGQSGGVGSGSAGKIMMGEALLGGRGGGNGGRVGTTCGKGGNGGGAIQLSVTGSITLMAGAIIDVSGGGGHGGCKSNGGTPAGGGGGGGAGGLVYLEAFGDISVPVFTGIVASGGGGGEGGDTNEGNPGKTPDLYSPVALGGFAGFGGNGGSGGKATGGVADTLPTLVGDSASAGGGGGATGRVFFRTHPTGTVTQAGFLYAESKTETF